MGRRICQFAVGVGLVAMLSCCGLAVRWSPGELDLVQGPSVEETYGLRLQNDGDDVAQLRLYVADWLRDEDGVNDFGVPTNGARWIIERSFPVGEPVTIRYAVRLPSSGSIGVRGTFRTWSPQEIDAIGGVSDVGVDRVGEATAGVSSGLVSIRRSVERVDEAGVATVALTVRTAVPFDGLTIEEIYDANVEITGLDAAEGRFDTVNRSCADWVTLSHESVRLDPDESVEITMTLATPAAYSGMHWCILIAESEDVVVGEIGGARIVTRPSVGLKVFASAPGTLEGSGTVTSIDVAALDPLAFEVTFANTGNAQLVVTTEVQVVDRTGEIVRAFLFTEYGRDYFRILPGSARTLIVVDPAIGEALPAGIYQAVISFDFGGDALVAGAKAFRVE